MTERKERWSQSLCRKKTRLKTTSNSMGLLRILTNEQLLQSWCETTVWWIMSRHFFLRTPTSASLSSRFANPLFLSTFFSPMLKFESQGRSNLFIRANSYSHKKPKSNLLLGQQEGWVKGCSSRLDQDLHKEENFFTFKVFFSEPALLCTAACKK